MKRVMVLGVISMMVGLCGSPMTHAEDTRSPPVNQQGRELVRTILQIGGRFCEYVRSDVEAALRRFEAVQAVEFLNNHGTVLVQFERSALSGAFGRIS